MAYSHSSNNQPKEPTVTHRHEVASATAIETDCAKAWCGAKKRMYTQRRLAEMSHWQVPRSKRKLLIEGLYIEIPKTLYIDERK